MKQTISLLLALVLLLCGCYAYAEPVQSTEAPVYFNPLNGEILDEPFNKRIFAVSINNLPDACPHAGVADADVFFEMFVNDSIIRGLALFTDPSGLSAIGSVRSNRLIFNDLVQHYDCILVHAGGSNQVMTDCNKRGLDHFNIDDYNISKTTSFRDKDRSKRGYGWEHVLFAIGDGIIDYARQSGMRMELDPELDYNFRFADSGTPDGGVDASDITLTITIDRYKKDTRLIYDPALDAYIYNQYGKQMNDEVTDEPETFRNILILEGSFFNNNSYHQMRLYEGGNGWFISGGKAIPIRWGDFDSNSPLWFCTMDGEPLTFGRGSTYIALTQTGSKITGIGE